MGRTTKRLATVLAAAMMGIGGAASAGAAGFDLTGGEFSGSATGTSQFTIDDVFITECSDMDVTGTTEGVPGNPAALTFSWSAPVFSCNAFGLPMTISTTGGWEFEVKSKIASSPPTYAGELRLPAGAGTTIGVPASACSWTVAGAQTFTHGSGGNVITAVQSGTTLQVSVSLQGIAYTTSGSCPFTSGTATYDSNGAIDLVGVTVDEL